MLIYAQQNAVIITHFKRGKRVAAGNACGQDIAFGAFKQLLFQRY